MLPILHAAGHTQAKIQKIPNPLTRLVWNKMEAEEVDVTKNYLELID